MTELRIEISDVTGGHHVKVCRKNGERDGITNYDVLGEGYCARRTGIPARISTILKREFRAV